MDDYSIPFNEGVTMQSSRRQRSRSEQGGTRGGLGPDHDRRWSRRGRQPIDRTQRDTPAPGSLTRRLKLSFSDGTQNSSSISCIGSSRNTFFSLTHGFVYAFGSVNVIVSSSVSRSTRRYRSSKRACSLIGLPK